MKEEDGANQLKFQLGNISHLGILLLKYVANLQANIINYANYVWIPIVASWIVKTFGFTQ
jgi:hypothetical protein